MGVNMELSLFLAKFLGLYFLILAVISFFQRGVMRNAAEEIFASRSCMALTGFVSLLFGLAIVVAHPIFELNWRGLITLIGCISLLKGVIRLAYPEYCRMIAEKMLTGKGYLSVMLLAVAAGSYLVYQGFLG